MRERRGVICAESLSPIQFQHIQHTSLIQPLIPFYTHTHTVHTGICSAIYFSLPPSSSWMIIKSIGVPPCLQQQQQLFLSLIVSQF